PSYILTNLESSPSIGHSHLRPSRLMGQRFRQHNLDKRTITQDSTATPPFSFAQSSMPQTILSVRAVTKSFGNLLALDAISIDVEERKVSILVGPNGSGKTTLI